MILAERLTRLRQTLAKETPDKRPEAAGEEAGAVAVDSTVAPIVRGLKLSNAWQGKMIGGGPRHPTTPAATRTTTATSPAPWQRSSTTRRRKRETPISTFLAHTHDFKGRAAICQEVKEIVFKMRDALPHQASEMVQVHLRVGGRPAYGFRLHLSG